MTRITLTSEQTAVLAAATEPVLITDCNGKAIANVPCVPLDEDAAIIAECKRRMASDSRRIPSEEVLAKLDRLNEQAKS